MKNKKKKPCRCHIKDSAESMGNGLWVNHRGKISSFHSSPVSLRNVTGNLFISKESALRFFKFPIAVGSSWEYVLFEIEIKESSDKEG
ncbi:hypothetical protein MTR_4g132710 [Medicago truncatula]|uniref:Uncharacterized protein n=1 Tax=Medicago truncatula TaxID=3880 RepID=G7JKF3_MEDTR|nr:hypothetical protein MTR_4g132710 [Medicago truncatula]